MNTRKTITAFNSLTKKTNKQFQQLFNDKYNVKDKIQNTQHAIYVTVQRTTSNREHDAERENGGETSYFLLCLDSDYKRVLYE